MSIYHKIIKLSTLLTPARLELYPWRDYLTGLITIVSMASLVFNVLFPNIALAKSIDRKSVLSFNFPKKTYILPLALEKNSITLAKVISGNSENIEKPSAFLLPIEPAIEESNDRKADKICREAGITDLPCWQDLKAIRNKESYDGKAMTGDNGRSKGWYHIQVKMHGISYACALDFECSTEWTVKNLIAHNYKTNRFYAISRHNGGGKMAQIYAKSIVYNSAKFDK